MSKDDFRDRLKSYASEPDQGEWSKMEQLLDADQDDNKKGFLWWRLGAVMLLAIVGTSGFFLWNTDKQTADFKTQDSQTQDVLLGVETAEVVSEEILDKGQVKTPDYQTSDARLDNGVETVEVVSEEILDKGQVKTLDYQTSDARLDNGVETTKKVFEKGQVTRDKGIIVQGVNTNVAKEENKTQDTQVQDLPTGQAGTRLDDKNQIAEVVKEETKEEEFVVEEVEKTIKEEVVIEEVAEEAEPVIIGDSKMAVKPWHVVTEVGVKYPIVDLDNVKSGSLVPSQKLFPSYTAGLGVGRSFGKFSTELGVFGSLYQFKLGKLVTNEFLADINNSEIFEERIITSTEQYTINKFVVVSPYIRAQYSIPLKRNFVFGVHTLFNLNSVFRLLDENISNIVPSPNGDFEQGLISFQPNIEDISKGLSLNADIGCSIEKLFSNNARIAVDLAYTFATGTLEEGDYFALRNSEYETGGAYKISGKGPKIKFRYYLNFGK